jgi:hypothetical protein
VAVAENGGGPFGLQKAEIWPTAAGGRT